MEVSKILIEIDAQIAKLQQARNLLSGEQTAPATGRRRGRPPGSKNAASSAVPAKAPSRRQLSPEGRKRIADAMKRRWAERKTASK